jgi:hypothetical protein
MRRASARCCSRRRRSSSQSIMELTHRTSKIQTFPHARSAACHSDGRANFSYSWTCGGEPFGSISVRTEVDAWFWCSSHETRKAAIGNPSNSVCQLPGRRATLAALAPGFAARSIPTVGTVGAASRCSTALANYLHVGAVTAWPMLASGRRAVLIGRKRSGYEARTYVSGSRKNQGGCTGGRIFVFALAASHRPESVLATASPVVPGEPSGFFFAG